MTGPTDILFVAFAICELSLISLFILYLCMKIPGLYSSYVLFFCLFIYLQGFTTLNHKIMLVSWG